MNKTFYTLLKKSYEEYEEFKRVLEEQKDLRNNSLLIMCGLEEQNEKIIAEYEEKVRAKEKFFSEEVLPIVIEDLLKTLKKGIDK